MSKHTPGPWSLCAHLKYNDNCSCGYRGVVYGPEGKGFAVCQPGHESAPEGQEGTEPPRYPRDVEIANARLIAAAPDLLVRGKHLAVKLAEVYRAAGINPAECQAFKEWMEVSAKAEGRSND